MTQKERQERSRKEIMNAALAEFGAVGYGEVTMERICTRHDISKGMMYHYFSNKDELFLLCVEDTLERLREYLERNMGALRGIGGFGAMRGYFLLRAEFFGRYPERKLIFEDAVTRPTEELAEKISALREPLRKMNRTFLMDILSEMPLRIGLDRERVARYLESLDHLFWQLVLQYLPQYANAELETMLTATNEILEMVLFGIVRTGVDTTVTIREGIII